MGGVLNSVGKFAFGGNDPVDPSQSVQNMSRPKDLTFASLLDENGNLKPQYQLSSGDEYSDLAKAQLAQNQSEARDNAAANSQGTLTSTMSTLASRGGLSEGARIQLARQQMEDQMKQNQGITQSGIKGTNDIGMKQFDIGREAEKTNLGTTLADKDAQRQFDERMYNMKMQEYGASKTADSMAANAPKPKGGVVGGITQGAGRVLGKGA